MSGRYDPHLQQQIVAFFRRRAKQYKHLEVFLETCDLETQMDMVRLLREHEEEISAEKRRRPRWGIG